MKQYLQHFDTQAIQALAIGRQFLKSTHYKPARQVLFWGMGGSALSGDLLRVLASEYSHLSFTVHRSERRPSWVDRDTFVIFSSYSGNTEEILKPFAERRVASEKCLVITSGGQLMKLAHERKIPCLQIPAGIPPRCALSFLTFSLLPCLEKIGHFQIPLAHLRELMKILRKDRQKPAKALARRFKGRFTRFYGNQDLMEPVLMRWRAQFAENAKTLASYHVLPEAWHNEIEGWKHPEKLIRQSAAVFFLDRAQTGKVKQKITRAASLIRKRGGTVLTIPSEGRYPISRIFSLVCLGDWVSYYLALLNRENPIAIPVIESLKRL